MEERLSHLSANELRQILIKYSNAAKARNDYLNYLLALCNDQQKALESNLLETQRKLRFEIERHEACERENRRLTDYYDKLYSEKRQLERSYKNFIDNRNRATEENQERYNELLKQNNQLRRELDECEKPKPKSKPILSEDEQLVQDCIVDPSLNNIRSLLNGPNRKYREVTMEKDKISGVTFNVNPNNRELNPDFTVSFERLITNNIGLIIYGIYNYMNTPNMNLAAATITLTVLIKPRVGNEREKLSHAIRVKRTFIVYRDGRVFMDGVALKYLQPERTPGYFVIGKGPTDRYEELASIIDEGFNGEFPRRLGEALKKDSDLQFKIRESLNKGNERLSTEIDNLMTKFYDGVPTFESIKIYLLKTRGDFLTRALAFRVSRKSNVNKYGYTDIDLGICIYESFYIARLSPPDVIDKSLEERRRIILSSFQTEPSEIQQLVQSGDIISSCCRLCLKYRTNIRILYAHSNKIVIITNDGNYTHINRSDPLAQYNGLYDILNNEIDRHCVPKVLEGHLFYDDKGKVYSEVEVMKIKKRIAKRETKRKAEDKSKKEFILYGPIDSEYDIPETGFSRFRISHKIPNYKKRYFIAEKEKQPYSEKPFHYITYDIESYKQHVSTDGNRIKTRQIPYTISYVIKEDFETENKTNIDTYNFRMTWDGPYLKVSFYGVDCITRFIDHIEYHYAHVFRDSDGLPEVSTDCVYNQWRFIAHNGGNYDFIKLHLDLFRKYGKDKCIMRGTKIITSTYGQVSYVDSLSLFDPSSSLDKLARSMLGVSESQLKLPFPYEFPNENNLDYDGDVPEVKYWKDTNAYERHVESRGYHFNLRQVTLDYCEQDVYILHQVMEKYYEMSTRSVTINGYTTDLDLQECLTSSSAALEMFKQLLPFGFELQAPHQEIINIFQYKYEGGLTAMYRQRYDMKTNPMTLSYIDFTSSYPYIMIHDLPLEFGSKVSYAPPNEFIDMGDEFSDCDLYYAHLICINESPYFISPFAENTIYEEPIHSASSNLKRNRTGKKIYTRELQPHYYYGRELNTVKRQYRIRVNHCYPCIRSEPMTEKYIMYCYEERAKVKQQMKHLDQSSEEYRALDAKQNSLKLSLNGLYGKFAQNVGKSANFIHKEEIELRLDEIQKHMEEHCINLEPTEDDDIFIITDEYNNKNLGIGQFIHIGSYITACARMRLWHAMEKVSFENVYYCDTDSLIYTHNNPDPLLEPDEYNVQIGTKLGQFKYEVPVIESYYGIGKKMYAYDAADVEVNRDVEDSKRHVCHIKGIKNNLIKKEDFETLSSKDSQGNYQSVTYTFPSMWERTYTDIFITTNTTRTVQQIADDRMYPEDPNQPSQIWPTIGQYIKRHGKE